MKSNTRSQAVLEVMADNQWHTLAEISERTGYPEASVSSQLRDFRKPHFGGFKVEKRFSGTHDEHTHEYRMT